jgi:YVTN family beta-propeller protein
MTWTDGGAVSRRRPTIVALAAASTVALAAVVGSQSIGTIKPRSSDPPARSAKIVHLAPTPASVIEQCRRVQAEAHFRMLCPRVLPRALIGWPGQPPPPLRAVLIRSNPRRPPDGVDIGYGAPWEFYSGQPASLVRPHLWRNRPCCFLHFVVQRGAPASGARPAVLGGKRGRLLPANSAGYSGLYFGNHVRFFFRERAVSYVVTLHSFGNRETTTLLGTLISELEQISDLRAPLPPKHGTTVTIGSAGPRAIAAAPGTLWVLTREQPIDPAAPWSGSRAALLRLDPDAGTLRTRLTIGGDMRGLAATEDAVWVAAGRSNTGVVLRIDPKTKRVVAQIHTGTWPAALSADAKGVWVVNTAPFFKRGTLVRVSIATNRAEGRPVPLGPAPSGVAVGAGAVWVADAIEDTVRRIDVARRRTVATIRVGRQPYALTFAAGSVWITNSDDGTVARIDPSTNKVVARIRVGRNPYGIAAGARSLWVASLGAGTISRLQASSGRVVKTIRVGGDPLDVALASGAVWFSQNSDGAVTRLGNYSGHASFALTVVAGGKAVPRR